MRCKENRLSSPRHRQHDRMQAGFRVFHDNDRTGMGSSFRPLLDWSSAANIPRMISRTLRWLGPATTRLIPSSACRARWRSSIFSRLAFTAIEQVLLLGKIVAEQLFHGLKAILQIIIGECLRVAYRGSGQIRHPVIEGLRLLCGDHIPLPHNQAHFSQAAHKAGIRERSTG